MVRKLSVSPEESDLSLTAGEDEKEVKEADPLSSNHPKWSSRIKCFEAYACVVMSFTSTLKHCKTIGNYGSVAFVAYVVYAFLLAVPIVSVEVLLGRYVMGNVTKAWSMCPLAIGVLVCLFGTTALTIVNNNVCSAYLFKYLFSFNHVYIPWDACRKPWAKDNCFVIGSKAPVMGRCIREHSESYCRNLTWESSGVQYWKYAAGSISELLEVCLTATYLALSIIVVVLINLKGHQSCEKVLLLLMGFPIIFSILLAFVTYSSLDAISGLLEYLHIEWKTLFNWKMWLAAFEDILVSLNVATLALSFVASHRKFKDDIFLDALVIVFTCVFSPTFLASPIMCMIGHTKKLYNHSPFPVVSENKISIFMWMSEALLQYPYPNVLWAFIFYLEMLLIVFSNQSIMVLAYCEAVGAVFFDKNKYLCNMVIVVVMSFALSIPFLFIKVEFEFPVETLTVTIILLFAITWQVCYGFKKFSSDYHFMLGYPPPLFFLKIHWIYLIPMLTVALTLKAYYKIPNKPLEYIVWIYIGIPVGIYIFVAFVQVIRFARLGSFVRAFMADPDWGPDNRVLKISRVIFETREITKEFIYRQELFRKPQMKPPNFSDQNVVQLI